MKTDTGNYGWRSSVAICVATTLGTFDVGTTFAAAAISPRSGQGADQTEAYANVLLIAVDPARRVLVIQNQKGQRETLEFDDLLASAGAAKGGDRANLTVRGGPGRWRVARIAVLTSTPEASPTATVANKSISAREARRLYATRVAAAARDARPVDKMWKSFLGKCKVTSSKTAVAGRGWFGLWDGSVELDFATARCSDLLRRIVDSGQKVQKAMLVAIAASEGHLTAEEAQEIRRRNNMNWDGWSLPAPARRD